VLQAALLFEPGKHDANGGIAGRARKARPDFLRRRAVPSAKMAFMISRSRRVNRSFIVWGIVCDTCHMLHATAVACQARSGT